MFKFFQAVALCLLLQPKAYAVVPTTINNVSDINFPSIMLNIMGNYGNCDMDRNANLTGSLCANPSQYQGGFNVGTVNVTHNTGAWLTFGAQTVNYGPYRVTLTLWNGATRVQNWTRIGTAAFCWEPWLPCTDAPMTSALTIVALLEVTNEPDVVRGIPASIPAIFSITCNNGC